MYRAGDYSIPQEFPWIGDWAARRALLTPNREAIYDHVQNIRYTFADLNNRANKLARVLLDYEISKGDRVAIFATNIIEFIDLFLATGKIGAILVPFNVRLSSQEILYLIKKTKPSLLFYEDKFALKIDEIKNQKLINNHIVMGKESLQDDPSVYNLTQKQTDSGIERPIINLEDPHLILFTGGTTGLP